MTINKTQTQFIALMIILISIAVIIGRPYFDKFQLAQSNDELAPFVILPPVKESLYQTLSALDIELQINRDPFSKPYEEIVQEEIVPVEEVTILNFIGFATKDGQPVALINNEVVTVGSMIDGKKVMTIAENKVVLSDGQENFVLNY